MQRILVSFIVLTLLSSCVSYRPVAPLSQEHLSSPPHPVNPELFDLGGSLPNRTIVTIKQEQITSTGNLKKALTKRLRNRSLDGAIITYRDYATHEAGRDLGNGEVQYYTEHNHFAEYYPFIYLDEIASRGILDSIVLEVSDPNGDDYQVYFLLDWQEQLRYMPAALKPQDFRALAVQPWFFLRQRSGWYTAYSSNVYFSQRRYGSGPAALKYTPSINYYNVFYLNVPGPNYKLWVSLGKADRYHIDSLQYEGERIKVLRDDFLGIVRSETFRMPDGRQYHFRYFYKRPEHVPKDWIIDPKSLQH